MSDFKKEPLNDDILENVSGGVTANGENDCVDFMIKLGRPYTHACENCKFYDDGECSRGNQVF